MGLGLECVKTFAQGILFFALAVVPRTALQAHYQNIIANEMRFCAGLEQTGLGLIRAQRADFFRRVDSRAGAGLFIRLAQVANVGNWR